MEPESLFEIKSRPVYPPVEINERSSFQLFISEGVPCVAIKNIYESCVDAKKEMLCAATVTDDTLKSRLSTAPLNSTVYIAGAEPFMWDIANKVKAMGLVEEQIRLFKPEANERHVFCVHCFTITEGVTSTPAICSGCHRKLLVTDHFARLHSAYMGYQVNAEDPADVPETEELS